MEVLIALLHLEDLGGMQTYSLTLAASLERLGHPVTLYAERLGEAGEVARARGLRVVGDDGLGGGYDAVVVQDAVVAVRMAGAYPHAQRAFVAHGAELDLQRPPLLAGVAQSVIALNDRVASRLRALPGVDEVVRLSQPVDLQHFRPAGPLRERPERVLLLGNHLAGPRRDAITDVCRARGLSWTQVGAHGQRATDVRQAIAEADVVVGYGRSILEAMASGRAAYVYDQASGDGWVTESAYPSMEADGFAGLATDPAIDGERFARDLDDYRPRMGPANTQLARKNHAALDHAEALVRVLEGNEPARPPAVDALAEVARLTRLEYAARAEALAARAHLGELRGRLHDAEARATEAEAHTRTLKRTLRWRIASRIAVPLDRARRRR